MRKRLKPKTKMHQVAYYDLNLSKHIDYIKTTFLNVRNIVKVRPYLTLPDAN